MRSGSLLLILLVTRIAAAQATNASPRANGNAVSGVVHDSIARLPLAGATVQLIGADSMTRFGSATVSDSLGRFVIADVPVGRYRLGFLHAKLDSLGIDAPLREIHVDRSMRVDLAIPSPARLLRAICRAQSAPDSAAVVIGTVRDARDRAPIVGAVVDVQWLELTLTPRGMTRHFPRRVVITGEKGWFAACDVPSRGAVSVLASRESDSTDLVELHVPPNRLLRTELYVGPMRTTVLYDTASRRDSSARARRVRMGDGRLSGTVVAAVGGRPVAGAIVSIPDGPQVRANESGAWTLVDAPPGTRTLEIRAVGFYPEQRVVDVIKDAAHIRVSLSTLRAVLDTVKVRARYQYAREHSAFQQRRRSGVGRYLTAADIARQKPLVTSDLFRNLPGVRYDLGVSGKEILLRGGVSAVGSLTDWCTPSIYLDGHLMHNLSAEEIDDFVRPEEIVGIEVYSGPGIPPQFQPPLSGCGSIVIWTK